MPEVWLGRIFSWMKTTVNGERYRAMLEDYSWPELDELDMNDMWFQQDGATSHTARVTIDLLKGKFGERVISRNGPVEWPLCSCDLMPLDFFLWGHIKVLVYANKSATLDDLKDNIQRKIANVPVEIRARVLENWVQRIDSCKRACGGHMTDIHFRSSNEGREIFVIPCEKGKIRILLYFRLLCMA